MPARRGNVALLLLILVALGGLAFFVVGGWLSMDVSYETVPESSPVPVLEPAPGPDTPVGE